MNFACTPKISCRHQEAQNLALGTTACRSRQEHLVCALLEQKDRA